MVSLGVGCTLFASTNRLQPAASWPEITDEVAAVLTTSRR